MKRPPLVIHQTTLYIYNAFGLKKILQFAEMQTGRKGRLLPGHMVNTLKFMMPPSQTENVLSYTLIIQRILQIRINRT
jgi:hypothetical protein